MSGEPEHTKFVSRGRLNGVFRQPVGGGPRKGPRPSRAVSGAVRMSSIPNPSKPSTTEPAQSPASPSHTPALPTTRH